MYRSRIARGGANEYKLLGHHTYTQDAIAAVRGRRARVF